MSFKIYIIAGEPSGDLLGSRLIKAFRQKYPDVEFKGVGGDTMEQAGVKSLFDITDLAVMGFFEVIPSIPRVLKRISQTVKDTLNFKPDAVVSIDSWGFVARVHKALRRKKTGIKQIHYVAPQVWAWKKKRAKTMHNYVDYLLTLLPYEPKYFTPYGLQTDFVGHPVIESDAVKANAADFYSQFKITPNKTIVSILPGSRHTEVSRLLPTFLKTARLMYGQNSNLQFVIPTVKTVATEVKDMLKNCNLPVIVTETEQDRYCAFKASSVAMAASGTVALELAILDVPHIIAYKVAKLTAILAKLILHIQFVNLSNILLGREVVPELLQERCVEGNIKHYMDAFLEHKDLYERQMSGFKKVREILGFGTQTPSQRAADLIVDFIKNDRKI